MRCIVPPRDAPGKMIMPQNTPHLTLRKRLSPWKILGAFGLGLCLLEGTAMAQNIPAPPGSAAMRPANPIATGRQHHVNCHWRGHGIDRRMEALLDRVHATPTQQERIRALRNAMMETNRPLMRQMRAIRGDRMRLLAAPVIDRSALEALRSKQLRLSDEISKSVNQMQYETAQVLTPAQRQEIYQLIQDRRQRRKMNGGDAPMGGGAGYRQ